MKTLNTQEEFQQVIKGKRVIVLFSADWCPDCRVIEPFLPTLVESYPNISFRYANRDAFIEVAQTYDVFGIPSFLAFHEGEIVDRFVSKDRKTEAEIRAFIENIKFE